MRRTGGSQKPEFVFDDDGKFLGVNLGSDFCAEHEWGIKDLKTRLGVRAASETCVGVDRMRIGPEAECNFYFHEFAADKTVLLSAGRFSPGESWENYGRKVTKLYPGESLASAWDERSFAVQAREPDSERLRELHKAFQRGDVLILMGGAKVFVNAGLYVLIESAVPEKIKTSWRDGDVSALDLAKASEATGIVERLKKAKKQYFALSPRWLDADSPKAADHKIVYWLNPMDQQTNNFGWFTVEELDAWICGQGPIPKAQGRRAEK